jgi:hypothetical protein
LGVLVVQAGKQQGKVANVTGDVKTGEDPVESRPLDSSAGNQGPAFLGQQKDRGDVDPAVPRSSPF